MRGIWRIRQILDRLDAIGPQPEPEPEPQPIAEPAEAAPEPAPPRPAKGLWMAKESPWAYVVVPKSACTTAGQYLYYADHGYYYYDDIHRLRRGLIKAGNDSRAVRNRLEEVGDDLFTFTFVRDPYARLVSGFLDKVVDLEQHYRPDIRDRVTSDWGVQLHGNRSQVENFQSFVRFVEYQYDEWKTFVGREPGTGDHRENWQRVDIHWLRQAWFLKRGRRTAGKVDFIGTIETMSDDLQKINDHLGPKHAPAMADMPRFGAGPKREAPLTEYFDAETKAIVDGLFAYDFSFFGYPTVVGEPAPYLDGFERAQNFESQMQEREGMPDEDVDDDDPAHNYSK